MRTPVTGRRWRGVGLTSVDRNLVGSPLVCGDLPSGRDIDGGALPAAETCIYGVLVAGLVVRGGSSVGASPFVPGMPSA